MNSKAKITNIQKFSVKDGPGIRSIVFFKGCTLSCKWCANPENIGFDPELMFYEHKCIGCGLCIKSCISGAVSQSENMIITDRNICTVCGNCTKVCSSKARVIKGEDMTEECVLEQIDEDIPFYRNSGGGVTFSGGEPLLKAGFVADIAADYRRKGLSTAVETCGCVPWENIETVKNWIDIFLYDIKFVDHEKHITYCGRSNVQILENLRRLCITNDVIVRIPLIPGVNDTVSDIDKLCKYLTEIRNEIKGIQCLPYHDLGISKYEALGKEYELEHVKVPDQEHLERICEQFAGYGLDVQLGG